MASQPPTLSGKQAVLAAMPDHPAIKALLAWKPDALSDAKFDFGELTLTIASREIRAACSTVQAAGYNFFEDMTAVDWYPLARLRVLLDEAEPSVASIVPVWPGANFFEREVFDLFGIRFADHPDLRRIMLPDDWTGHPLRKDYPVEGYR